MKQQSYNIDEVYLTKTTGDPFADVGGLVIQFLQKEFPDKDILELIEWAANVYVLKWEGKLHPFFHGSKITNPSIKDEKKKILGTIELFKDIILDKTSHIEGFCRITGRNTNLFSAGMNLYILVGSGGFINFHHGFQEGIQVSKEVLIRLFFVPFGVEYLGDKLALTCSNSANVNEFLMHKKLQGPNGHLLMLASNSSTGVLKSHFYNPVNALFDYAEKCIIDLKIASYGNDENHEDIGLNLFHFTNFIINQDIQIYTLPALVFRFYGFCISVHQKEWSKFLRSYYQSSKFKNAAFNQETDLWENNKEVANYDIYKVWKNPVLENLLNNVSILYYFRKWSVRNKFNFRIVEVYQINLRNMEKRTLEKIKQIADFVVQAPTAKTIEKAISKLNGMRSSHEVRQYLLRLIAQNYTEGNAKPLITLEEFVEYLFPDGTLWREIRDLLLIAIYQKLHELPDVKITIEVLEEEEKQEIEN